MRPVFQLHRYVSPILGIHFCWVHLVPSYDSTCSKRLFVGPSSCANHPKPQIHPVDICWWLIMARFFGGVLWFNMTGMTGNGDGEIWPISTAVHAVYSGEVMTGPQISPQHARELATINRSMHILGSCLQLLSLWKATSPGKGHVRTDTANGFWCFVRFHVAPLCPNESMSLESSCTSLYMFVWFCLYFPFTPGQWAARKGTTFASHQNQGPSRSRLSTSEASRLTGTCPTGTLHWHFCFSPAS